MAEEPEHHTEIIPFRKVPLRLEHTIDNYQAFYNRGHGESTVAEQIIKSSNIVFRMILKSTSNDMLNIIIQYVSSLVPEIMLRDQSFVTVDYHGEIFENRMYNNRLHKPLLENRKITVSKVCKHHPSGRNCTDDVYKGKVTFRITGSLVFQDNRSAPLSLSIDVARLLNDDETKDITLNVDDQMFTAHKFILSARSPVFRAMLMQRNMKESHENIITITDTEPDAFEQFLHFLYTDQVSDLAKFAPDLLILADKYNVDVLKQMCEHSMIQNINVENCAEYCVIGDLTNANRIYEKSLEFIKDNLSAVLKSEGWNEIKRNTNAIARFCDILNKFAM